MTVRLVAESGLKGWLGREVAPPLNTTSRSVGPLDDVERRGGLQHLDV